MDSVLSPERAAALLGVSVRTVYQWLRRGQIPGRKVGGKLWMIREEDLLRHISGPVVGAANPTARGTDAAAPADWRERFRSLLDELRESTPADLSEDEVAELVREEIAAHRREKGLPATVSDARGH